MKIYAVGGAVRDALLGLPVRDRDYVVVGTTPDEMLRRGFKPVGKDFPVFLHPQTHEEYALARTERKTAPGYTGFIFHADADVTLQEDLARRDLTINAIAQDEQGTIVDPYGGVTDLKAGILRHVGPAFSEDPVRILRIARFSARFAGFSIAPATLDLMRGMVTSGEVDHLVAERVWQEFAKGLMETYPSRLFEALRACGALQRLLPEVDALFGVPQRPEHHPEIDTGIHVMLALDEAARVGHPLDVRYAVLLHDLGKGTTPAEILPRHLGHEARSVELAEAVSRRLKVPAHCRELAVLVAGFHGKIHRADELRAGTLASLLESCDALRRPDRFFRLLDACACDYRGRRGFSDRPYPQADLLRTALAMIRTIDVQTLIAGVTDPTTIPARLHEARARAIKPLTGEQ